MLRSRALPAWCWAAGCDALLPHFQRAGAPAALHASASSGHAHDADEDDPRISIPWVRTVISGVGIMRHPRYNKGLAFSNQERATLHLRGLLPPAVLDLDTQMKRVMINIRTKASDLERYGYMQSLQERNENLFYSVLRKHIDELLPIVHLPTVREACKKYGLMFKSLPRSLFITQQDTGNIVQVLKNWPERRIKVVMITTGHNVGAAGDLGVHAVNATIAKLSLITAVGGVAPPLCLPILVDLGTDNEELLKSQFYSGLRHKRVSGDSAQDLMHEIMSAVEQRFGKQTLVFFEDMMYRDSQRLLSQYRMSVPCFNDGHEGFATAVLAATLGAVPDTGVPLHKHRVLITGCGVNRIPIAEMLATAAAQDSRRMVSEARQNIYLADHLGLVTATSEHSSEEDEAMREVLLYTKDEPDMLDLEQVIERVKPTVLISCSSSPVRVRPISERAVRAMSRNTPRPIIFALSSPDSELSAAQAYHWSDGKAMFANFDGPQEEVATPDGRVLSPSKVQSVYVFPGMALGVCATRSQAIKESQLIEAARAIAQMVDDDDRLLGRVLPPTAKLRDVARRVAVTMARTSYDCKVATALPKPPDMEAAVDAIAYDPAYVAFA